MLAKNTILILVVLAISANVNAADFVWIEGESCQQHTMQPQEWYDRVITGNLSGGGWLSHFAGGPAPVATYNFSLEQTGEYHVWIRCNPVAQPQISYKLDGANWKPVDLSESIQRVNIALDGKPDLRFIGWTRIGIIPLANGRHTIEFRFQSGNNNHGAIDCFVLSLSPFQPRGKLKPGERSGQANEGFFAWEPDIDLFADHALVDLSAMNEDVAGAAGRVRATETGFALGNGQDVRFWASNAGPAIWSLDHPSHIYLAKRLAKNGVNMVRLHGPIYDSRNPTVNRKKLDQLHHLVFALRNEGIYTAVSFYFPLWFHLDGDRTPFMLLFFDPQMQETYYRWADALLMTQNPYTKTPLGKDPAVAIVELQNEDSLFFWTFSQKNMPKKRWETLKTIYGSWLTDKHGSIDKAVRYWGGIKEAGDNQSAGRMELYDAWNMTSAGVKAASAKKKRLGDQVEFLTDQMRQFYREATAHLRDKCEFDGLISCGNWHVTDASKLDALERYCYTVGDVIDHHGYYDHGHEGQDSAWAVRPGQTFTSRSALSMKNVNPLPYVETDGYPHIISEIGWPMPNMYRAEFTFLAAAYGALQGLDGVFTFSIGSAGWDEQISKFPVNTPTTLGCFPAAALIFRRGYVREAPIVVMDQVDLDRQYSLKGTSVHVTAAFDQLRAVAIPKGAIPKGAIPKEQIKKGPVDAIDPLTFYVGRVVRSFKGSGADSFQRSVNHLIDRSKKRVKSITNELVWDYGSEMVAMNTPKAQGVAGFLGKTGAISLANVAIDMRNPYGTVTVVALDDQPIADSKRLLIQCMSIEQFAGFKANGPGSLSGRIERVGSSPCGVERFDVSVKLKLNGATPSRVVACDEHGYPTDRPIRCSGEAASFVIQLDPTSVYHVVER